MLEFKEYSLDDIKIALDKIVNYREQVKEGEKPTLDRAFSTEPGIILGSHADDIIAFAMRGHILSFFLPFMNISQLASQSIVSGEMDDLIPSETTENEIEKLKALKTLMADFDYEEVKQGTEILFDKTDKLWYFGFVTFSLYAYLDVYTMNVLDIIESNQILRTKVERYLVGVVNKDLEKNRDPVFLVSDMKRFGLLRRLETIEKSLGFDKIIEELQTKSEFSAYWKALQKFIRIRHKVAHRNPRLPVDNYSFEILEKDLEETQLEFDQVPDLPSYLSKSVEQIQEVTDDALEMIRKTTVVVGMATFYPMVFDALLSVSIRKR